MEKEFKPQAYTLIYWLIQNGKIDGDQLFDFLELYWPTFIQKNGYVFLKEQYSEEKYHTIEENHEFWINFLGIDDYFINSNETEKQSINFSKILAEIWRIKLKKDFPSLEFTVKCLEDHEYGDYGLTFYQTKHEF
jgi:hypothetical protein